MKTQLIEYFSKALIETDGVVEDLADYVLTNPLTIAAHCLEIHTPNSAVRYTREHYGETEATVRRVMNREPMSNESIVPCRVVATFGGNLATRVQSYTEASEEDLAPTAQELAIEKARAAGLSEEEIAALTGA